MVVDDVASSDRRSIWIGGRASDDPVVSVEGWFGTVVGGIFSDWMFPSTTSYDVGLT